MIEIYFVNVVIIVLGDVVVGMFYKFVSLMWKMVKLWGIMDVIIINVSGLINKEVGSIIGYSNVVVSVENEMLV